jgi:hypothetical protein
MDSGREVEVALGFANPKRCMRERGSLEAKTAVHCVPLTLSRKSSDKTGHGLHSPNTHMASQPCKEALYTTLSFHPSCNPNLQVRKVRCMEDPAYAMGKDSRI